MPDDDRYERVSDRHLFGRVAVLALLLLATWSIIIGVVWLIWSWLT